MPQLQDEVADAARAQANAYRDGAGRPLGGSATR